MKTSLSNTKRKQSPPVKLKHATFLNLIRKLKHTRYFSFPYLFGQLLSNTFSAEQATLVQAATSPFHPRIVFEPFVQFQLVSLSSVRSQWLRQKSRSALLKERQEKPRCDLWFGHFVSKHILLLAHQGKRQ